MGDQRGGKHRDIQLHGDLFRMLAFAEAVVCSETAFKGRALNAQKPRSVDTEAFCVTPLVAGTRFHLNLRPESARLNAVAASITATPVEFGGLFRAAA